MTIRIDGKTFQPLKKGPCQGSIVELAGLDPKHYQIFLIDKENNQYRIDGDEGLELQDGMELSSQLLAVLIC